MKISDEDFMESLWLLQITNASKSVLQRYVGGGHGLCHDDDFWRDASLSIHKCYRHRITDKLGKQQILARVRDLIKRGFMRWDMKDCTFILSDDERNQELFASAREFWLAQGVPFGTVNGVSQTIKIENYETKCEQALVQLKTQHAPYWLATAE
jgi:hypothetical protein